MLSQAVIAYLFFGGTGGGGAVVLSVLGLASPRWAVHPTGGADKDYSSLFFPAYVAALGCLALGLACLCADLGRLDRILLLLFNPTVSFISLGVFALLLNLLLTALIAGIWKGVAPGCVRRLSPGSFLVALRVLLGANLCAGLVVALYTGLFLASIPAVPLWSTCWLPVVFVVSSLSCGIALVMVCAQVSNAWVAFTSTIARLSRIDLALIGGEALTMLLVIISVHQGADPSTATWQAAQDSLGALLIPIPSSNLVAVLFWTGFVGAGLCFPVLLNLVSLAVRKNPPRILFFMLQAAVLLGGLIMRFCIVQAGFQPSLIAIGAL